MTHDDLQAALTAEREARIAAEFALDGEREKVRGLRERLEKLAAKWSAFGIREPHNAEAASDELRALLGESE